MPRQDLAGSFPMHSTLHLTTNFDELLNSTRSQWTMRDEGTAAGMSARFTAQAEQWGDHAPLAGN